MNLHPRAGQLAQQSDLINVGTLISQYYELQPDINNINHIVKFGTSGHRGSAKNYSFNEIHILAISQAIAEERKKNGITGPCYIGKDTHALSEPAIASVLKVLTANNINVIIQKNNGYTPTPSISNAILEYNKKEGNRADGIVITPSHNPPEYGGIKYNFSNGGPANTRITKIVEDRANQLIRNKLKEVKYLSLDQAWNSGHIFELDLIEPYVEGLSQVINFTAIQKTNLKIGIDPLGGSGIAYWKRISEYYKLDITIINDFIDQTFRFMNLDKDGSLRMDCSSKWVMTSLLSYCNKFDLSFGNDPDCDRHGIVTHQGIMNPNHYLAVAINYLFQNRPYWNKELAVGKTLVTSSMIDRIVSNIGRKLIEVPVGFKWLVDDLFNGSIGFGGEESAGASFLRFDGSAWSTDKDGIILCLLAAEMMAVTGKSPQQHYNDLVQSHGKMSYNCLHNSLTLSQRSILNNISPEMICINQLAGDPITVLLTFAPESTSEKDYSIYETNGFKIMTKNGWFAVRPSGTEQIYKIYCESFLGMKHRQQIEKEAIKIINNLLKILS